LVDTESISDIQYITWSQAFRWHRTGF